MTIEINFIGHSCFLIALENHNILIDPFISQNPCANININKIKISDILVTHAHGDHLGDAIPISKKSGSLITAIFETANYCSAQGANAQGCNIGGNIEFDWGCVKWLNATHSNSTPDGGYGGCAASILIDIHGKKIFHAGDTGLHSDLKFIGDFYKPDVAMLPIGGFYTMDTEEAVQAVKFLKPSVVIPMHYDTFPPIKADPRIFKSMVEAETETQCVILEPNEQILI